MRNMGDFRNIFIINSLDSVNNILTSCTIYHTFLYLIILTENCMNLHLMYKILFNTYKNSSQSYTKYTSIADSCTIQ